MRTTIASLALLAAVNAPLKGNADSVLVVGQGGFVPYSGSKSLLAFGKPRVEPETTLNAGRAVPRARKATPEILAAINETGFRYSKHPGVSKAGLSPLQLMSLFRANIEIESAYNPRATSSVGAFGLGQLMPETARDLGVDRNDMHQNLDGSARYLANMLDKFGTKELALAAYNAGPGAVETHGGIPPYRETQNHVVKVVGVYQRIVANGS